MIGRTRRAVVGIAVCSGLIAAPTAIAQPANEVVINTFAGTGDAGVSGDGVPAVSAAIGSAGAVATAPDGTLYIAANQRIRAVDPRTQIIRTIAGNGTSGFSGDGGPATAAAFSTVNGMAVGSDGTLYLADTENNRVRAVDPHTSIIRTVAGIGDGEEGAGDGGPATDAVLDKPNDVAVAGDGTLFIADTSSYRVRTVDPRAGIIRTVASDDDVAGSISDAFYRPMAITVHPDGRLYVADEDEVVRVDLARRTSTVITHSLKPSDMVLSNVVDLSVASNGIVHFANADTMDQQNGENRLYALNPADDTIRKIAGGADAGPLGDGGRPSEAMLGQIGGLAEGPHGRIYLSDASHHRVRVIEPGTPGGGFASHSVANRTIDTLAGTKNDPSLVEEDPDSWFYRDVHARDEVDLENPSSVVVAGDGTIYFADSGNDRIRSIAPNDGTVRTIAGTADPEVSDDTGDGQSATEAELQGPHGLALGPNNTLYFIDTNDEWRVRVVDLNTGEINTVPGTAQYSNGLGDLAIASDGTLYLADAQDGRVCALPPGSRRCTDIDLSGVAPELGIGGDILPRALALGPDGTLYVGDVNSRVVAVDLVTGKARTIAGVPGARHAYGNGGPATSAGLGVVAGLAVDGDGTLYIADMANHRVRAIDPRTGIIRAVTGHGQYTQPHSSSDEFVRYGGGSYGGDGGKAGAARLNQPIGLAIGPDGAIYIADSGNDRIRAIGGTKLPAGGPFPFGYTLGGAATLLIAGGIGWRWKVRSNRRGAGSVQ